MIFYKKFFYTDSFSFVSILFGMNFFLLLGCNSTEAINKDKKVKIDKIITSSKADSDSTETYATIQKNSVVKPISDKIAAKFRSYMGKKDADSLIEYVNGYETILTAQQFEQHWRKGEILLSRISENLNGKYGDGYTIMEKMSLLDKCFGLRASCDAECTVFIFAYDASDLKELALVTAGKEDDDFFSLMESVQGETVYYRKSWLNTFARTWDYGGGSLLGDSSSYTFLKQSTAFMKRSKLFNAAIKSNRDHVLDDMSHSIYMYSKEKVMTELALIQKAQLLNAVELKKVIQIQKRIQTNDPQLQFGCDSPNADCDFGG